jgi:hypothetical protein
MGYRDRWDIKTALAYDRRQQLICGNRKRRPSEATSAAAMIPTTKPDSQRCGDRLDEQLETASIGRRRDF